jgi:hypothetical protein
MKRDESVLWVGLHVPLAALHGHANGSLPLLPASLVSVA